MHNSYESFNKRSICFFRIGLNTIEKLHRCPIASNSLGLAPSTCTNKQRKAEFCSSNLGKE